MEPSQGNDHAQASVIARRRAGLLLIVLAATSLLAIVGSLLWPEPAVGASVYFFGTHPALDVGSGTRLLDQVADDSACSPSLSPALYWWRLGQSSRRSGSCFASIAALGADSVPDDRAVIHHAGQRGRWSASRDSCRRGGDCHRLLRLATNRPRPSLTVTPARRAPRDPSIRQSRAVSRAERERACATRRDTWDLGIALGWAAERTKTKGFAGVTVACEPTGHRWRVLGQLAADRPDAIRVCPADGHLMGTTRRGPHVRQDRREGRGVDRQVDRAAALLRPRTGGRDLGPAAASLCESGWANGFSRAS
jgi:hypothetical protein